MRRTLRVAGYLLLAVGVLIPLVRSLPRPGVPPLALTGTGTPSAPPASPHPGKPLSLALSFRELGVGEVVLRGAVAEADLYLPLPPGLRPQALEVDLQPSPLLPQGWLAVLQGDTLLDQTPLPREGPVRLDLSRARPQEVLALRLESRLVVQDLCAAQALYEVRLLGSSRLLAEGTYRPPQTLAEFFPPYLRTVRLVLPPPLTPEGAEVALWLAAFLGRAYPGSPPELRLLEAPPAPALEPGVRTVLWQPGVGASLVPLGEEVALALGDRASAARLLFPSFPPSPLASEAVRRVELRPEAPREAIPLENLAAGPRSVSGMGTLPLSFRFALADLGPGRHPLGLWLRATHSPVPEGQAQALLYLNGSLFHSLPLAGTHLEAWVPVPTALLERNNLLEVRFQYAPPGGACQQGALPFTAALDPGALLVLGQGNPLRGFDALPQDFLPRFGVYLDPLDLPRLALASRLVQALQATTRTPLYPFLQGEATGTPLLAVGGPGLLRALGSPVQGPFRLVDSRGRVWLETQPGTPYALLASPRPGVLLLSGWEVGVGLLEGFLNQLLRDGWYGVHGDLALGSPGQALTFSLKGSGLRVEPLAEPPQALWARYRGAAYLVLAGLLLLVLAALYPRVVRTHGKG